MNAVNLATSIALLYVCSCPGGKKGIVSRGKLKLIDIPNIDPGKYLHGVDATQAKAMSPYKAAKGFACCISILYTQLQYL